MKERNTLFIKGLEGVMVHELSHDVSDTDKCGGNMSMRHACVIVRERTCASWRMCLATRCPSVNTR
jgi:hypothetical protein